MPKRNFRYLGAQQVKTTSDGSGIAELYDIYASRVFGPTGYPSNLLVTSNLDASTNIPSGSLFGITYTFENYFTADTFTTSINFNGTAATSDFIDYTGISFAPTLNPSSGITVYSTGSIYRMRDGASQNTNNNTFTIELKNSSNDIVHSVTLTMIDPTYTLAPQSSSYNEGSQVRFTFNYTNAPPSQTMYYAFSPYTYVGGTVSSDDVNSTIQSTITTNSSGTGTATLIGPTMQNDFTTEGAETMNCRVANYTASYLTNYYVANGDVTINDTSIDPTATITPSSNYNINEGSSQTFTITMTNYSSGSVPYEIGISGDTESGDVNVPLTGNISISNSTGSITVTAVADGFTETGQLETFFVRIFHPNGSGTVLATSGVAFIQDTSTGTPEPAGIDITSSYYEFSNRHIDSNVYMNGSSADYTGPYDVAEVQQGGFSGTGRVYLAHKVTSTTTFYGDAPIAAVQILSSGGSVLQTWTFNGSTGGTGSGWQTMTIAASATTTGLPLTPNNMTGQTFTSMSTSANTSRFSWATSTGSSFTGAADGIATPSGAMTVGNGTISQSPSTYYMYRETSGSTFNTSVYARSPTFTFSGGEKIRIAHALTGYSSVPQNPNESLWVGVGS
jgi:hypothetical protein